MPSVLATSFVASSMWCSQEMDRSLGTACSSALHPANLSPHLPGKLPLLFEVHPRHERLPCVLAVFFFSCWAACDFIFQVSGGCPLFRGLHRLPWRQWSSSLGCSAPSLQFPHGIDQTLNCSHLFVNVPDTQSLSHLL